jgi:hypothetical protein
MNDLSLAPENYLSSAFKTSLKSLEKNTPIYSLNLLGGATFFPLSSQQRLLAVLEFEIG